MSAYNTTLLDEDDNEIYPKTLAENVYDGNTRIDQKVNGIRTDLGNPSSASAVTGADAFSKISKLNSDLASNVGAITNSQGSSRWFSANLIKKNNICYFDISVELASPAANSAVQIAEFPANFRPSTKKYYPCVIADGNDANSVPALIDITTAGICKVHTPATALTGMVYAYVSGTFVIS